MSIAFRPARAEELQRVQELAVGSINDLTARHGMGSLASVRPVDFQLFSWKDDGQGFWTAERDGEPVGFAFSWVCGELWFLAELFIAPAMQGQGIGQELLKRTLEQAKRAGVAHRALITFTFNRVSQSLYIRHGLFPRIPLYMLSGARDAALQRLPAERLAWTRVEGTPAHIDTLARIDRSALGLSREKHHRYLIGEAATKGFLLQAAGDCVGYAYVNTDGHIGPLAVTRPEFAASAFATALHLAADGGAPQLSAFIPGPSEAPLQIATEIGMRIVLPMVLMSSTDFGDWRRYLPRNPRFM